MGFKRLAVMLGSECGKFESRQRLDPLRAKCSTDAFPPSFVGIRLKMSPFSSII